MTERVDRPFDVPGASFERSEPAQRAQIARVSAHEGGQARPRTRQIPRLFEDLDQAQGEPRFVRRFGAHDGSLDGLDQFAHHARIDSVGTFEGDHGLVVAAQIAEHDCAFTLQFHAVRLGTHQIFDHG